MKPADKSSTNKETCFPGIDKQANALLRGLLGAGRGLFSNAPKLAVPAMMAAPVYDAAQGTTYDDFKTTHGQAMQHALGNEVVGATHAAVGNQIGQLPWWQRQLASWDPSIAFMAADKQGPTQGLIRDWETAFARKFQPGTLGSIYGMFSGGYPSASQQPIPRAE